MLRRAMLRKTVLLVLALSYASAFAAVAQNSGEVLDVDVCISAAVENWSLPQTLEEASSLRDALNEIIVRCSAEAAGDTWKFSVRLRNADVYSGVELASSDKDIDAYNNVVVVAVGDRSMQFCTGEPVYAGFGYAALSCEILPEGEIHRAMVSIDGSRWPCQLREQQPEETVVLDCYE